MYDVIIIGCGIIGAAAAYELSKYDLRIAVLEKENDIAAATTKANSAIIHAGFDPKPGTLMARLNVEGNALARELFKKLDIPHRECGALVLAFSREEMATLNMLLQNGITNGVPGLRILSREQALELEQNLNPGVVGALETPTAMIVSPWEYTLALAETAVLNGVELYRECEVVGIEATNDGYVVQNKIPGRQDAVPTNTTPVGTAAHVGAASCRPQTCTNMKTRFVINAAGLYADKINNMVSHQNFEILPDRGEYFLLDKSEGSRVGRIIFQCPTAAGKGVLVAPTVHGNLIVGPSSVAADSRDDVSTTAEMLERVKTAAQKSVPDIDFRANIRNFAGIRAKTARRDFIIEETRPGFINLAGIASPGLSAAPAIAKMAAEMVTRGLFPACHASVIASETKQSSKSAVEKTSGLPRRYAPRNDEQNQLSLPFRYKSNDGPCRIRFNELSPAQKSDLISRDPAYGNIVCRCETITEGEIRDTLNSPIPPRSVDGVKRRTGAGMGRCQGGFCSPRIVEMLANHYNYSPLEILQEGTGTEILMAETKGAAT